MLKTPLHAIPVVLGTLVYLPAGYAQSPAKILRFEPDGPGGKGLSEPLGKVTGSGDQKAISYRYYQSRTSKEAAGIWATKAAHDGIHRATNTEVFYLNAGRVTLQDESGRQETFKAGDAVLIPRGTEFAWKQSEDVKEYFVVFDFDSALGGIAATPGDTPTFVKLEPKGPTGKGLTTESLGGREYKYYSGPTGSSVGVWETDGVEAKQFSEAKHSEFMVILSGAVTLSSPDGTSETFKAGDVALVPRGAQSKWSSGKIRKFWVAFDLAPSGQETARR
jgi:uncharacterized cupin superfamily protein